MACRDSVGRARRACLNWETQQRTACQNWRRETNRRCTEWETRNERRCTQSHTESERRCDRWQEERSRDCDNWIVIFRWLCLAWTWVTTLVCRVWSWISKVICDVWTWVTTTICRTYAWITTVICSLWVIITTLVCRTWVLIIDIWCLFTCWIKRLFAPTEFSERISECIYGWNSTYRAEFDPKECVLTITLRIRLVPDTGVSASDYAGQIAAWEQVIENHWSGQFPLMLVDGACTCKQVTVVVDVQFVNSGEHHTVTIQAGSGRANMTNWFVT